MPKTVVIIYQEIDGTVPFLDWMDGLTQKVQDKCIVKIELLTEFGYELRRPNCDILHSGIYELRVRHQNVNYRILYGFYGENIVLLSHGCTKEAKVPEKEIEKAKINLSRFKKNQQAHTYSGEL